MKTRACHVCGRMFNVDDIDVDALGSDDGDGFVCFNCRDPNTEEDPDAFDTDPEAYDTDDDSDVDPDPDPEKYMDQTDEGDDLPVEPDEEEED